MSDPARPERSRGTAADSKPAGGKGLVGQLVAGRYRIDGRIASGGFGAVYAGTHVHMGHRVAVKVLHPQAENLPGLVERFRREAIVGAHVRHPNIASAIDYGTLDDGSYYLVLEHASGATLTRALKQGRLAPDQALSIARQLCEALGAAHGMGIVHRDVKPANVMLVKETRGSEPRLVVKLIDFGFAKVAPGQLASLDLPEPIAALKTSDLTVDGMVFGTVAYIAPEAFYGMERVDVRSDLYAVGLMLYEMLAGRRPFLGKTDAEMFTRKLEGNVVPLTSLGFQGPGFEQLDSILARLLHSDAGRRYQTAQELLQALGEVSFEAGAETQQSSSSADAAAPPAPSAAGDGAGRRRMTRVLLWAWAGLLVVAAVAAVVVIVRQRPHAAQVTRSAPAPAVSRSAEPPASATAAVAPPPSAAASATLSPKQVRAARRRLEAAERTGEWKRAYQVFEQLADSSPTAFADPRLRSAAASTLSALAHSRLPELQQMLEILEGQLGSAGPDVLFHVVQFHGGSKARALALASLAKPRVKALSSPELQAAMTLQAAGCKAGADTLREAVAQGDARALLVLKALRTTCAPAHERDAAFRKLEARLTKR